MVTRAISAHLPTSTCGRSAYPDSGLMPNKDEADQLLAANECVLLESLRQFLPEGRPNEANPLPDRSSL